MNGTRPVWQHYTYQNSMKDSHRGSASPGGFSFTRMEVTTMPRMPKHPCGFPGCPNLTDGRFCEEHTKQENRRYERYQRDPATKQALRQGMAAHPRPIRRHHPFCEECYKRGVLTPTEEIHHIVPLSHGGTHAEDNLMALCKPCHSRITVEMGDRWPRKE